MCYFITIGLPEDKAQSSKRNIPRGFHIALIANTSVLQAMGHGFCTYLLMSGGCSCDLFRAPPTENEEGGHAPQDSKQERLRHKYERMGWSAVKIDRALAQHRKDSRVEPFIGLRGDVQQFLGELAQNVRQLAVVVHWYDGDVQEARFACKQGEVVSLEIALKEGLRLATDEIVWIKR